MRKRDTSGLVSLSIMAGFPQAQSPAVISHHHVIGVFNALLQFAVRDTKELDALLAEIKTYGDSRTSVELKTLFDIKEIPLP